MKKEISPEQTAVIERVLKEIGNRIKTKRKELSPNYEDFAYDNGFNKVTISRIEQGKNSSLKQIIIVAEALGMKLEDLFKGIK